MQNTTDNLKHRLPAGIVIALALGLTCLGLPQSAVAQHPGGHPGGNPGGAPAAVEETPATIAAAEYLALDDPAAAQRLMVEFLAGPECNGRRTGTPGADLAADYLAAVLEGLGCQPAPDARGFKQGFSVTQGIHVIGEPSLALNGAAVAPEDFAVAGFSGSGSASGAGVLFAGYGITAPELGWDDYAGVDAAGMVVVALRGEPRLDDPQSPFAGDKPSTYSDIRRKASLARDMGAAALVLINNPLAGDGADLLPELTPTYSATNLDLPVCFVHRDVLVNALIGSTGLSWHEIVETMDLENSPMSTVLDGAEMDIEIAVEKDLARGYNIIGVVPGSDPELAEEYVIVGAHYDHLGTGGPESVDPARIGEVHAGADDNASGVAAVVEVARWAAGHPAGFGRSLLVTLFSGEEMGLLGSAAVLRNTPVPPESIHSMINLDMVGHLRDDTVIVGGVESAAEFAGLLESPAAATGLSLNRDQSGLGGSDHTNFINAGIPSLFLCTGAFLGYHSPDDTAAGVNYAGLGRVTALAAGAASALALFPGALTYNGDAAKVTQGRNRGKLKVSMGTVPHYGGELPVPGMGVGDVVPDGPAALAGIQGGDVIVKILDRRIADIYDFMFVLQDCDSGQTVPVVVYRDGGEMTFEVTLAARNITQ